MDFKQPKVKRISRFRPERSVPYPLSLKGLVDLQKSKTVIGKYNGSNVVIDDPEVTVAVYNMGCFGKGSLSRGEPNYYLRGTRDNDEPSSSQVTLHAEINKNNCNSEDKIDVPQQKAADILEANNQEKSSERNSETRSLQGNDEARTLPLSEFKFQETLHLNLEEAYFLYYGLGCLHVVDLFDKALSLQEAWELFCESQDDFVQKYVVYHYYRAKGWVVKPGLKFGGDFVLYKWGVNITHASYIVVIEVIRQNGDTSEDHQQPITWNKFIGLNRMAETAGKEVLLCRVVWPQDVLFKDVHSPEDIKKFSIEEILTRRWVSSQERELLENEELE